MRWPNNKGELKSHSDNKYRIKWDKPAPSKGAQIVKDFLKKHCYNNICFEEYRLPHTLLRVDFLNATKKFAIEFNGVQHNSFIPHFHKDKIGFWKSNQRDMEKRQILERAGYIVVEIVEEDFPLTKDFFKSRFQIIL